MYVWHDRADKGVLCIILCPYLSMPNARADNIDDDAAFVSMGQGMYSTSSVTGTKIIFEKSYALMYSEYLTEAREDVWYADAIGQR